MSRSQGFTLLEIMIVVLVIGLLSAIAVPSYLKSRQAARVSVCLNNLRIYQQALDQYAFPHHQFPTDLQDLVTEGYLKTLYTCPLGGTYEWTVSGGNQQYHLVCRNQHTPTCNHICIHEDQAPMVKGGAADDVTW